MLCTNMIVIAVILGLLSNVTLGAHPHHRRLQKYFDNEDHLQEVKQEEPNDLQKVRQMLSRSRRDGKRRACGRHILYWAREVCGDDFEFMNSSLSARCCDSQCNSQQLMELACPSKLWD